MILGATARVLIPFGRSGTRSRSSLRYDATPHTTDETSRKTRRRKGEGAMSVERDRVETFGQLENGLRDASDWYLWGPYLSERQWGTVREDYSGGGDAWDYFPHDHARSRAYRWGEDGLAGFSDVEQRLCLSLALWNGRDPILKER